MQLKGFLFIPFFLYFTFTFGQNNALSVKDTAEINALIDKSKALVATDSATAIKMSEQALERSKNANYAKGEALAYKNIGMVYYLKNYVVETLLYWNKSLETFEKMGDDVGIANMLSNIGAIYMTTGDDVKALDHSLRALKIAEQLKDTNRMVTVLMNIGGIYHNKHNPVAMDYYLKVQPLVEKSTDINTITTYTGNLAEIYSEQKNYEKAIEYFEKSIAANDNNGSSACFALNGIGRVYRFQAKYIKSLEYHNKALDIAKKFDDNLQIAKSLRAIGDVYLTQRNLNLAINYFNQANAIAENLEEFKVELKSLYQNMAEAYAKNQNFEEAFKYQTLYANLKDSLYADDTKSELTRLQTNFELSQKDAQIALKDAKLKTEKQARMGITITLVILLIGSIIIYRNYLDKVKTNKILDKKNDEIEGLLLNILPKEIALELQANGISKPRHFEEVSVLFADFQAFTSIADKMSPDDLVEELNECFIAFDDIVEKYGLEKIKTIGDAYMCASNLPSNVVDHSYKIIMAAIEITQFLDKWNFQRQLKGKENWEVRIGIHTGPVVAGVVGKKKYAYDIWGNTVNIASRMESAGTAGKVNISAHLFEKVKDRFEFEYRGKISAKNIGEVDMYYVVGVKELAKNPEIILS